MMGTAPPDAVHELLDLTDGLVCVLVHLPSIRDFGRASCVCRAWRADGSPVEQALRCARASGRGMARSPQCRICLLYTSPSPRD